MTPDEFSDSFYYRAIRTKIGDALRSQLVPTEPVPERLSDLLKKLDQPRGDATDGTERKPERPAHKRED